MTGEVFILPIYNAMLSSIDQAETKRYAGLHQAVFDDKVIEKACLEAQLLAVPKGIWQIYDYDSCTHQIETAEILGSSIQRHLQSCTKAIILAVTIGEPIEAAITDYFKKGEYSYSLLLDAAATTAVEMAADCMEKAMQQVIAPQGYAMKTRFSPGYGDWDITFQPHMLRLAGASTIGMELTDSYMLMPRKSITAIIGLTPKHDAQTINSKHDCKNCNKIDCIARKESYSI